MAVHKGHGGLGLLLRSVKNGGITPNPAQCTPVCPRPPAPDALESMHGRHRGNAMRWIVLTFVLLTAGCAVMTPAAPEPPAVAANQENSQLRMAILPFETLDRPPTEARVADSARVSNGLRARLAADPALEVVIDDQMMGITGSDLSNIARQLGVDFIVTGWTVMGSTARSDQVLRIHYQLFDAEMGTEIWSQTFDQDYAQIEEMLDGTAIAIRRAIPRRAFSANGGARK